MENIEYLKNKTILLVEDEDNTREMNAGILSLMVDNVIESIDGLDGLKKFEENGSVDLVIADINMPKMNGIKMCEAIRKIDSNVAIIIITGYDEDEYQLDVDKNSIARYLVKPVDGYELIDTIKEILIPLQ
jgi:two-component system, cell cycle response regulator